MHKNKIISLIKQEISRQQTGLVMIASENYASPDVLAAMGTPLSNKYSEGYPGKRYYTGNQYIDDIESLAQELALKIFNLNPQDWHVNVQPHSGSSANLAAYLGLLKTGDTILGMDLGAGGHLTHGSPVNWSGKLFNFVYYTVDSQTHTLDYQEILRVAQKAQPKLIVCGATAYTQLIDFKQFRQIADQVNAYLLADIAHIAGLVVGEVHPSPFPYADVVTTTTHKTLRGPRSAIIICKAELAKAIDTAVFPGMQGGPLDHVTAAKAMCFAEALSSKFKQDQIQTVKNAQVLAQALKDQGLKLIADSTQNHLLLVDCQPLNITGKQAADALARADIYTNANMIPFDPASPLNPSGIRLGTPALTTRGMQEPEMQTIAGWIVQILKDIGNDTLISDLKQQVHKLTKQFPVYHE